MTEPPKNRFIETPMVRRAADLAKSEHDRIGQKRSNGDPYWTHPERIYNLLVDLGVNDEAVLAAAWLHDVPEDCTTSEAEAMDVIDQFHASFSSEVGDIVQQLTNWIPKGTPFPVKQASLIKHAQAMSPKAKLIKVADRYDNLSGMETWPLHIQKRYAKAGLELLEALAPIPFIVQCLADSTKLRAEEVLGRP